MFLRVMQDLYAFFEFKNIMKHDLKQIKQILIEVLKVLHISNFLF